MNQPFLKIAAAGAVMMIAAGCSTLGGPPKVEAPPPANPAFAGEMAKFNAQFPNDKASKYEEVSINFNNSNKLDERGNCHDKSKYPVVIVLTLDSAGKVIRSTTDVDNSKAECFRQAYASAQLPAPPFAPYLKPIKLR
ncbi:hypothetical protein [Duganella violaceipulchra]|uniref:Uncharacterized protein n=1 Tax=Duganella violaceipulchra TaxID=2849652 RepID=A0AA41H6Y3_9BURK|nr:hypothetical protein [Duganella violaceicalia]MBV6323148.1 hypothetical protein [Duganella violaceicalia]MCP2010066.1 hypothetical protein [Duganella violaceicalia]